MKQKTFLPALGGILVLLGQWSPHWELVGLLFLTLGASLSVVRCVLHYASLSQRRKILPYIGLVHCEGWGRDLTNIWLRFRYRTEEGWLSKTEIFRRETGQRGASNPQPGPNHFF